LIELPIPSDGNHAELSVEPLEIPFTRLVVARAAVVNRFRVFAPPERFSPTLVPSA
jgi:hypothetical protein